jgi:hypothetical protein
VVRTAALAASHCKHRFIGSSVHRFIGSSVHRFIGLSMVDGPMSR